MKLSEGVEWGLHCAVLLAALPPGTTLSARALAEYHGVSETYLAKHLKALAKAGLFASVPGPKGGFRLARPADQVTLLDIVQAIEGDEPAFRCTEIRQRGPAALEPALYRRPCAIHATMARAENAWRAALRAETLADLTARLLPTLDPRAVALATAWLQDNIRR